MSTIYLVIETTIQSAVPRARLHICRHGGWNRFSGQATHATPRSNLGEGISTLAVEKKQFHSCFEKNTMRHITRSCFQSKPARDHRHSPIFHWIALSHPPTPGLSSPLQAIKNARAGLNVRYQMCDFTQIFYIARSVLAILSLNIESPNNGIPLVI